MLENVLSKILKDIKELQVCLWEEKLPAGYINWQIIHPDENGKFYKRLREHFLEHFES